MTYKKLFVMTFFVTLLSQAPLSAAPNRTAFTRTTAALYEDLTPQNVTEFLNHLPLIRVPIINAAGNGHQSAGVMVVQRLRELGYRGEIQIVYENKEVAEKLTFLLPPFSSDSEDEFRYFPDTNLSFISQEKLRSQIGIKTVPLGIMGADDSDSNPNNWKVEALLKLQPLNWPTSPSLTIMDEQAPRLLPNLKPLGFVISTPKIENPKDFLDKQLRHSSKFAIKGSFLSTLLVAQHHRDILPVYAHGARTGINQLKLLIKGLRDAISEQPNEFKRGAIIVLINETNDNYFINFQNSYSESSTAATKQAPVEFLKPTDPLITDKILNPSPGEISVVMLGPVPKKVFELLYLRQTLPGIVEGQNSINLMQLLGLPYLPSLATEGFHFDLNERNPADLRSYENVPSVLRTAFSELTLNLRGSTKGLTQFYLMSKIDKAQNIRKYFLNRKLIKFSNLMNDQLFVGLKETAKALALRTKNSPTGKDIDFANRSISAAASTFAKLKAGQCQDFFKPSVLKSSKKLESDAAREYLRSRFNKTI